MESLDLSSALKRLGGDEELLRGLIRIFLEDSPAVMRRLRAAVDAFDVQKIKDISHGMRGLVSNFDANAATESALDLEKFAVAGEVKGVHECLHSLEHRVQELSKSLRSEL